MILLKFSKSANRLSSAISRARTLFYEMWVSSASSAWQERLRSELSTKADITERLHRLYHAMALEVEADRPLWKAVGCCRARWIRCVLLRCAESRVVAVSRLREILAQGQERGEITSLFPVVHLAEFMEALYHTCWFRQWTVDLTGHHKLTERVDSAVEFFLRGC